MSHSIQMQGINKSFGGVQVLQDVSLCIESGRVHALMGENGAGKSTLMKILSGQHPADSGQILQDGQPVVIGSITEAFRRGISMIHQELMPIPNMSVAENIFLGREPLRKVTGFVDRKALIRRTRQLFEEVGIDSVNPKSPMRELSVAEMQLVEIAKAVSFQSQYIIMDEPTSAITDKEVAKLFDLIRDLRARDVGIVYISHKMEEIFQIADTITVLRDGQYIDTLPAAELDDDRLISMMVGRELDLFQKVESHCTDRVVLEVESLGLEGKFRDVSFSVRAGEILGVAGLMGAGRTEVAETIFGLRRSSEGQVRMHGRPVRIRNVPDAIRNRIALIPEDRKQTGLNLIASVKDNIAIANLGLLSTPVGFMRGGRERETVDGKIAELRIKPPGRSHRVENLSGGNQQKVVLAKWLLTDADVIIFDEPTRGIDVGAKSEIHLLISQLARAGKAVVFISSEMPEIIGMSHRVLVMMEGRITGELQGEEITQERIMQCAMNTVQER